MKRVFLFLLIMVSLTFISCNTVKQEQRILGSWKVIYPEQFSGDIWVFSNTFDIYRNGDPVYHEQNWRFPDVDLSTKQSIAIFIFDDCYLTYECNNPGYSTDYFFQGTLYFNSNVAFTYSPTWDRNVSFHLVRTNE